MFKIFAAFFFPTLVFSGTINDQTFQNVKFKGYSVYTLKFTTTIVSSNSLKENVPKNHVYDHLEFTDQNIPVLKENSISDLEDLDEITIASCKLKEIEPGAFKNVGLLRQLSLKDNELEEIRNGVFNNLGLVALDLSNNRIKHIEADALSYLPRLLNINLADNLIKSWDKRWFYKCPLLTRISMQNNSIEKLAAEGFSNLNGNKKFGSVKLTMNLIFSYNKIREIDDNAFTGLGAINNLWLDNNQLTEFPDTLLEHVEVQDLRLEHNNITCLNGDLNQIIKAETSHMDGNPFDCNCLEKMKTWAKKHNNIVDVFYSDMNCVADKLNKRMTDLEKRLRELKTDREVEERTQAGGIEDEVEIMFRK
ncbi:unnamed protein product [Ceutorhynchus assimilis]|uniref:Uncharacterized protein n=1 Tax=Ceutorhynchus assimilis TaxID=467358 RepID=A0A9N9QN90_9CUCU|nr:unnamed protein product [Ceutorhynchus assimilis]